MRVSLDGGWYKAKSLIADAQRCVNLYPEKNPGDPSPSTHYLTPGLTSLSAPSSGAARCEYQTSAGQFLRVVGATVYSVSATWVHTALGTIANGSTPVSISDNGLVAVIVDGTAAGYAIDLSTNQFAPIYAGNGAFYGSTRVDFVDGFFLFNRPGTNQWYISLPEVTLSNLVGGPLVAGAITAGSGYTNGSYAGVSLAGGQGSGAIVDITVAGGAVTTVLVGAGGQNYRLGDVLTADLGGGVGAASLAGGSGYTDGSYTAIPLTGGAGSGAVATIVVSGGAVTSVTITTPGQQYEIGDVLSASTLYLGAGTGFTYTVTAIAVGSGFTYAVTEIGSSAFDPLDIASKNGWPDPIQAVVVMHREAWLIGTQTTEIWFDSGDPLFAFSIIPGVFLEHGCVAPYSISKQDLQLFWVAQDRQGQSIIVRGSQYAVQRISTHALEAQFDTYSTVSDAVGFTYQQEGHTFYQVTFPTADKTWVYDVGEDLWHERTWTDGDGLEHRHRAQFGANAFSTNVAGDWQTGELYKYDQANQTDFGGPIVRRRGFPHMMNDMNRVSYTRFIADMQVGTAAGTLAGSGPFVSLRWSNDRGQSFGNPVLLTLGSAGQYLTTMQARRLGLGRDRVFELFWDAPAVTALNGAFVEMTSAQT